MGRMTKHNAPGSGFLRFRQRLPLAEPPDPFHKMFLLQGKPKWVRPMMVGAQPNP